MRRTSAIQIAAIMLLLLLAGCNADKTSKKSAVPMDEGRNDPIEHPADDKDFSSLRTPGSQEKAYEYRTCFLPSPDGIAQPYVGDPMPYYEDGVYYIYYLKDGGDSYNHSVFLATTTDFVTYEEQDTPVLESSRYSSQDSWIGTGSVVKVDDLYYFFYTGHTMSENAEYKEKIMVAKSSTLTSFDKVTGWELIPSPEIGQKIDFRDPQAYYNPATGTIGLTITAAVNGSACIVKYSLSKDLQQSHYEGIIFKNTQGRFWNLECSDTFRINNTWYITYSAQDDTLWYASSENRYGPYSKATRLDGKLFYAAKHVEDGKNSYMVGWGRRSESPSSTQDVTAWAGNLVVQKITETEPGVLALYPVDAVVEQYNTRRQLLTDKTWVLSESGTLFDYQDAFTCYESFMITGNFIYNGKGSFGLAFDFNGSDSKKKMIAISPADKALQLYFNEGSTLITQTAVELQPDTRYGFTYIQEGSVGVFYINGKAALTVRLYGVSGKAIQLFSENSRVEFSSLRQYTPRRTSR